MSVSTTTPDERPERFARIFADAVELPADQREEFLAAACGREKSLCAELQKLLAAHETLTIDGSPTSFLEQLDVPRALALMRDTAVEVSEGATIGPYRVLRELGHGGMGAVYLADRSDGLLHQRVAIKVVRPWVITDSLAVKRFEIERRIVGGLKHPGIARLHDVGVTDDGRPWFAMEYVDGLPIDEHAERNSLTLHARLSLLADVCDAVGYAHARGVVHRDLKPANILVTSGGDVKLLDFGIAKVLAHSGVVASEPLTRQRARPMTLEYASPEQVLGDPVSPASDVHSLGVVLYRLLTGRHPYRMPGAPLSAVQQSIVREQPAPPSSVAGCVGVHGDIDRIVLKALRKDPQARHATANKMGAELRRYLRVAP